MIFSAFLKIIVIVQTGVGVEKLDFLPTAPDKAFHLIIKDRLISLMDAFPGSGAAEKLELRQERQLIRRSILEPASTMMGG